MLYTIEETAKLLQQGKFALCKDTTDDNKIITINRILRLAFPLKSIQYDYEGINYFFVGSRNSFWIGDHNNNSGLPVINLSKVIEPEHVFIIDDYTIKSANVNFIPKN